MFGILLRMSVGCGGGVVGAQRRERLLTLARESDRIALEFSLVAAGFAETDECEEDGFESPIAWIKANCHMSGGAAADRVCAGEQLDRLDRSEAAVLAGEIGFAHFAHIAKASAAVGERLDETTLLRHAGKESVAKFRQTCIHARHAADPAGVVEEEANGVEARYLTITDTDDGMVSVSGTLDKVGRARRVVSGPQSKALKVRDCGCVWPGCDRPASWTSAHHLTHWIHGGSTDLNNLVLVCYRHHWMVHEGGWQIVRSDDGRMLTIPPVTEFQRLARAPSEN